jgi:hypothetical protein
MKHFFYFLLFFSIAACGGKKNEISEEATRFKSESILVDDTEFPFQNDSIPLILEKVKLCKMMDSITQDTTVPPCDFRLFRYFSNNRDPLKEGFVVEIKPKVWSKWFLTVVIAKNKDGDYYKSNALHGQLLELKTVENGPYDIIMRYVDVEVGTVAILHKWNKTKYDPIEVLEINDHFVKADKRDSLNNVYLKNFVWGY